MPAKCLVRGSINVDEFFTVDNIVKPGETISATSFVRRPGGKGTNQAVSVARAGGQVSFIGCVGIDGGWVLEWLKDAGVDVDEAERSAVEATGRALIQVALTGENCILLHKGANHAPLPPPTPKALSDRSITHLLVQNEILLPATLSYLSVAQENNVTTIFNPSPMPSEQEILAFPWTHVSWLVVNEHEAELLLANLGHVAGQLESSSNQHPSVEHLSPEHTSVVTSAQSAIARLHAHPRFSSTTNIVCTLGAAGVLALVPALSEPLYLPASKVQLVKDTTGAGDCFTGYLAAGLMRLHDAGTATDSADALRKVLAHAVKAAGICVQRPGAAASVPTLAEVDAQY